MSEVPLYRVFEGAVPRQPSSLPCRGGLVFKAHRLFVSLNSKLESNKEEEEISLR